MDFVARNFSKVEEVATMFVEVDLVFVREMSYLLGEQAYLYQIGLRAIPFSGIRDRQ
jgi:hypothetical protein